MIPVPLFSIAIYILLAVSGISVFILLCWVGILITRRGARKAFRARLWLTLPLLILLAVLSTFILSFFYQDYLFDAEWKRKELARNITLEKPTILAGIVMPAGTRLHSMVPGVPETFDAAHFPEPTKVNGIVAKSLSRSLRPSIGTDGYAASSMEVTLNAAQYVDGWLCGTGGLVAFALDAGKTSFQSCMLSASNRIDDLELPAGAKLTPGGTLRGWIISFAENTVITVHGLPLQGGRIAVDEDRHLAGFCQAVIPTDLRLGGIAYPAGTRICSNQWTSTGGESNSLILSPVKGRVAKPDGRPDVPFGNSIVQTVSGQVLAIVPNAKVGIVDYDEEIEKMEKIVR